MRKASKTINTILFLFTLLIALTLFASFEKNIAGISTSGASPLNSFWDGSSKFIEFLASRGVVHIVKDWSSVRYSNFGGCTTLVFISPEKSFENSELLSIANLVSKSKASVIVLDEGGYGNQVLEKLGIPARIEAFKYILSANYSGIVYGYVNVNKKMFYIAFAYVSPVTILDKASCHPIAFVYNNTVGVECYKNGLKAVVIGDGSIATNTVFGFQQQQNVYVSLFNSIIDSICENKSPKTFFVDASKYGERLLSLSELVNVYGVPKAIAILINPARYLHIIFNNVSNQIGAQIVLAPLIAALAYVVARFRGFVHEEKRLYPYSESKLFSDTVDVLRKMCLEDAICSKKLQCLVKSRISRKCVKDVVKYFEENFESRKRLLQFLAYKNLKLSSLELELIRRASS